MLLRNRESWQDNIGAFFPSTEVFSKNTRRRLDNGHLAWFGQSVRRTVGPGTLAELASALGSGVRIVCNLPLQRGPFLDQPSKWQPLPAAKPRVTQRLLIGQVPPWGFQSNEIAEGACLPVLPWLPRLSDPYVVYRPRLTLAHSTIHSRPNSMPIRSWVPSVPGWWRTSPAPKPAAMPC